MEQERKGVWEIESFPRGSHLYLNDEGVPLPVSGGAAGYSCLTESESLPVILWKERQNPRHMYTQVITPTYLAASHCHIQVLGSTCPPNTGWAGPVSQADASQSPAFLYSRFPIQALRLRFPHLPQVSHSPLSVTGASSLADCIRVA